MEKDLKDLLIDELHDIFSSENQIVKALPKMIAAAESPDLKAAFTTHLQETKGQIKRLEKVFKLLKVEKKEKFCKATKGLIQECEDVLKDFKKKSPIRDAAIISKAQRIEHYEISAYGTVRTFAKEVNHADVAKLLQETLKEEENADCTLSKIAEGGFFSSGLNHKANEPAIKTTATKTKAKAPTKKTLISNFSETITAVVNKVKSPITSKKAKTSAAPKKGKTPVVTKKAKSPTSVAKKSTKPATAKKTTSKASEHKSATKK